MKQSKIAVATLGREQRISLNKAISSAKKVSLLVSICFGVLSNYIFSMTIGMCQLTLMLHLMISRYVNSLRSTLRCAFSITVTVK